MYRAPRGPFPETGEEGTGVLQCNCGFYQKGDADRRHHCAGGQQAPWRGGDGWREGRDTVQGLGSHQDQSGVTSGNGTTNTASPWVAEGIESMI